MKAFGYRAANLYAAIKAAMSLGASGWQELNLAKDAAANYKSRGKGGRHLSRHSRPIPRKGVSDKFYGVRGRLGLREIERHARQRLHNVEINGHSFINAG